jgi:hypothetical protein
MAGMNVAHPHHSHPLDALRDIVGVISPFQH